MSAPPRRNEPCPCGSGQRYKDCHGKLGAAPVAASPGALVRESLRRHQAGDLDGAERGYREVLAREPGHAVATHYLGLVRWYRGDTEGAEADLRRSIAAEPAIADFHNNLGLLLRDLRRIDEALACFRRTLEVDPRWYEALNNMGLALEQAGRWEEAIAAYREAIAREPGFAAARQNLARALLATGDYREGWSQYRWRLLAQGEAASAPDAAARPLPASLAGRHIVLRGEQGIGDVLFFLRFAPELARRGARLAFEGDARLGPLLARTGLFAPAAAPAAAEAIPVGDLPWLLEAHDPAAFPPPLEIPAEAARVRRLRASLPAGSPIVALTWRAGARTPGPVPSELKEVPPRALGAALAGRQATWVSVQRQPRPGEREALQEALGAPVGDASGANDDLEEALAWMALADDYVGVSNANTHLRAGLGLAMTVLVSHPPEWRWGLAERSAWFASARLRRASAGGWDAALAALT